MKAQQERGKSPTYQIEIKGHLAAHWTTWFTGFTLQQTAAGNTILVGPVPDQAALHGLLRKIHHLGLTLVAVNLASTSTKSDTASDADIQGE